MNLLAPPRRRALALTACAAALLVAGCQKSKSAKPQGPGRLLVAGASRNLQATSDGKMLAFVGEIVPPAEKGAPEGVFQGVLTTVPAAGGVPRQLGGGVTTLEDGFRLSSDGRFIAYLQGFRFRDQSGTLVLAANPDGEAKQLAEGVTYYRFSPDGRWLGFVAAGEMHLYDVGARSDRTVGRPVASFDFSPDSQRVLMRRPVLEGGEVLLARVDDPEAAVRKLGENAGDYGFSPDGKSVAFNARVGGLKNPYSLFVGPTDGAPTRRGEGVSTFLFSPDSQSIAFVQHDINKSFGDLHVAPVAAGGAGRRLGENVEEYRWAPTSQALALRENHEKSGRQWTEMRVLKMPGAEVRHKEVWNRVGKLDRFPLLWNSTGEHLTYLRPVPKPEFSVDLFALALAGQEPPRTIAKWVFDFRNAKDPKQIWYTSNCMREGKQCELMSRSLEHATEPPVKLAEGIWTFKPAPNYERVALTFARADTSHAADLGWVDLKAKAPSKGIDQYILPGQVYFLDAEGSRIAYIVTQRKREGVYVAELK